MGYLLLEGGAEFGATRRLLRLVARRTRADYAIRVGRPMPAAGFLPFPRQGPILTWRPLADRAPAPRLRRVPH